MNVLKIILTVPTDFPVNFRTVKLIISNPPVEMPLFKAYPVPYPLRIAPKIAQINGSLVYTVG